jgi:hypothetical protein
MLGIWRCRVKQPNSGEALKLILPSCSWKAISGWVNHSGTVTIYKTIERTMKGDRGSKSVICNNIAVKEQRVYGCLHIIFTLSLFKKFAFEAYRGHVFGMNLCPAGRGPRRLPSSSVRNEIHSQKLFEVGRGTKKISVFKMYSKGFRKKF